MPLVDPADLLDSSEVATLLGLAGHRSLSVYRASHADFPAPIIDRPSGRCLLWHRPDVEAWGRASGRLS